MAARLSAFTQLSHYHAVKHVQIYLHMLEEKTICIVNVVTGPRIKCLTNICEGKNLLEENSEMKQNLLFHFELCGQNEQQYVWRREGEAFNRKKPNLLSSMVLVVLCCGAVLLPVDLLLYIHHLVFLFSCSFST